MPKIAKEIVEIIGENGIKKRKKYPIEQNKVVIDKQKTKHAGWMPEFTKDSFLYYFSGVFPFKRLKRKLMIMEGADKCIEFRGKDDVEVPVYNKEAVKKLFEVEVIKHAGATTQKVTVPLFVYLLMFLVLMLEIVNILFTTGRIRF